MTWAASRNQGYSTCSSFVFSCTVSLKIKSELRVQANKQNYLERLLHLFGCKPYLSWREKMTLHVTPNFNGLKCPKHICWWWEGVGILIFGIVRPHECLRVIKKCFRNTVVQDGRPSKKCHFFRLSLTSVNHAVIKVFPQLSWCHWHLRKAPDICSKISTFVSKDH